MEELEVQKFLRGGQTLEDLTKALGIIVRESKDYPLVILNYDMLESPKMDPIVRECRSLVLNKANDWQIAGRAFKRFFNFGEGDSLNFDFDSATGYSKEDGSLMLVYNFAGNWRINSRGTFGDGTITEGGRTWAEAVKQVLVDLGTWDKLNATLDPAYTYVFEYVSPESRIIRCYMQPALYLLAAFKNVPLCTELTDDELDAVAQTLSVRRPIRRRFFWAQQVIDNINEIAVTDKTFEGFVLKDKNNRRIKIKSDAYLALHHAWNNGQLTVNRIMDIISSGASDDFLAHFPEMTERFETITRRYVQDKARLHKIYEANKDAATQKDFALAVKDDPLAAVLFQARKLNDFERAWTALRENVVWEISESIKEEESRVR